MIAENHISINKTARYYTLGQLTENTKNVWLVIHGFGQNAAGFLNAFMPLANADSFFVAPEALNRYYLNGYAGKVGATWMTKEDRLNEIKDYINYLDTLYKSFAIPKAAKVTALGFSQGASTLTRWLNTTACHIDRAIVYAGEVAPDILPLAETSGLKRTKNYFICGTADEIFTPETVSKMKENYAALNFTELSFDGRHEINPAVLNNL
ncbi:MAG TPA: hypothetical protein VG603_05925 [Chitinophagales bacterium]|nr:hypothetical protein [Chitinophagales bacterium]